MKHLLWLVAVVALSGCAQPPAGSYSTIPWEMRAEDDGLSAQQYGWYESSNIYTGQIGPANNYP